MRALLVILLIVVIVGIVAVATGFVNLSGHSGSMPHVAVQGGSMPGVKADVGTIDLGSKNTQVDVPTVGTRKETVKTPTLDVNKPQ